LPWLDIRAWMRGILELKTLVRDGSGASMFGAAL
jgi:hypothetical protein